MVMNMRRHVINYFNIVSMEASRTSSVLNCHNRSNRSNNIGRSKIIK